MKKSKREDEDKHETRKMTLGRKKVDIDEKIVELIRCLNKFGIRTKKSCQGKKRGYVQIARKNAEIFSGIVNGKYLFNVNLRFPTPR